MYILLQLSEPSRAFEQSAVREGEVGEETGRGGKPGHGIDRHAGESPYEQRVARSRAGGNRVADRFSDRYRVAFDQRHLCGARSRERQTEESHSRIQIDNGTVGDERCHAPNERLE